MTDAKIKAQGRYHAIENDYTNPNFKWTGRTFGFDSIEEFRAGLRELATNGWRFAGLHPYHMGANLDLVYIKRV